MDESPKSASNSDDDDGAGASGPAGGESKRTGVFQAGLKRVMDEEPEAQSELTQWKPRTAVTANWLLEQLWVRPKQALALFTVLIVFLLWLGFRMDSASSPGLFRWVPDSLVWRTVPQERLGGGVGGGEEKGVLPGASPSQSGMWEKHGPPGKPPLRRLSADMASLGDGSIGSSGYSGPLGSFGESAANEKPRMLVTVAPNAGPVSPGYDGGGLAEIAVRDSMNNYGHKGRQASARTDKALAAALNAATAPRAQTEPLTQAGEELASATRGDIDGDNLQAKLAQYAKDQTWTMAPAAKNAKSLPPMIGIAFMNADSIQQLWATRDFTQVALYCAGTCRTEARVEVNESPFDGEKR